MFKRLKGIALGGKSGAGKTTAASYLEARYNSLDYSVQRIKFADALYDLQYLTQTMLDLPRVKDRKFLQVMGTDSGRHQNSELWVEQTRKRILNFAHSSKEGEGQETRPKIVIIDDLRFPNEMQLCRELGFACVYIQKSNDNCIGHISENSLHEEDFDFVESNDFSWRELCCSLYVLFDFEGDILPEEDVNYRHYKGNTYQVHHSSLNKNRSYIEVVYSSMEDPSSIYTRDLSSFWKYLPEQSRLRFEKVAN